MRKAAVFLVALAFLLLLGLKQGDNIDPVVLRKQAKAEMTKGNFKDAYEKYEKLLLETQKSDEHAAAEDLKSAVLCLRSLGREAEMDKLLERTIERYSDNWRLLVEAAESYYSANHSGYVVAGEFSRGWHRGRAMYVNSYERDRVQALSLMGKARLILDTKPVAGEEKSKALFRYAEMFLGQWHYSGTWRLQYLTDLDVLPDYEEHYRSGYGSDHRGAPVDEEGDPVFYEIPEGMDQAQSDGERWRRLMYEAVLANPNYGGLADITYARFLYNQFGVQTIIEMPWFRTYQEDSEKNDESGVYDVVTLRDNETIARLANGIKRFELPDGHNYIAIFKSLAAQKSSPQGEAASDTLARIYENRRQYKSAAECWKVAIKKYGKGGDGWRQKQLEQIEGNWGSFERTASVASGEPASVDYRFRNGESAKITARAIDVPRLLKDVKEYLKSKPSPLQYERIQIENIGYMLVEQNFKKYVGEVVAEWTESLTPKENHFDSRVTISTPLKKGGAYLLTAEMQKGNTSRIILWIEDFAIVRKQLDKKTLFYLADAESGRPVSNAKLEFFGYELSQCAGTVEKPECVTASFAEFVDANGCVVVAQDQLPNDKNWLIMAHGAGGKIAYMGFDRIWHSSFYDQKYNERKVFVVTDRPVYRPDQTVKFKFWITHSKYDQEAKSPYAGKKFAIIATNPRGGKIYDKTFTADEYGGINAEFELPADAQLGSYYIYAWHEGRSWGGGHFRIEEYKKPEFEVVIESPSEPVMLGEKLTATIKGKYYFGAPVTKATVKYKVLRSNYQERWYPVGRWDWLYGKGYWWFGYDYDWYPGWHSWGCLRPVFWWWPRSYTPPEVVAEAEVPIGEDGTVKVEIDTALAKAVHGDFDHRYEISAEVRDESRRTIDAQNAVLVARKPFKVYAWLDRGYYKVGDTALAEFSARTLNGKPVRGNAEIELFQISYRKKKESVGFEPIEKKVKDWKAEMDADGCAKIQFNASKPGQYRIACKVKDEAQHEIEGAYVFSVRGRRADDKGFRFSKIELVPDKKEYAPGEKVNLAVNTDRENGTVLFFVRPSNGVCPEPEIIRLDGKSVIREIEVSKGDMPNFFVEALTVSDGKVHTEMREIVVPPENKIMDVKITSSSDKYKPGAEAEAEISVTGPGGKPVKASLVMSVYDKSLEYISGGSNVSDIKDFFWKWRRRHDQSSFSNLGRSSWHLAVPKEQAMLSIGVFGALIAEIADEDGGIMNMSFGGGGRMRRDAPVVMKGLARSGEVAAVMAPAIMEESALTGAKDATYTSGADAQDAPLDQVSIRKEFADTAFWDASLRSGISGRTNAVFKMPENLTAWKVRVWAMGDGTSVGESTIEVVTTKDLLLRLQAPRFFVEKDEVILSANIHNYLTGEKEVQAGLELDGGVLLANSGFHNGKKFALNQKSETAYLFPQKIKIVSGGEERVDWRVKVLKEGEAVVRMNALTDEESDAMEMKFPVYVHGMLKTDSFCGVLRPDKENAVIKMNVPKERRPDQSRLEVRFSPTLAGALVDALPYLADYPHQCTENSLNRFLPAMITQKILKDMGVSLVEIKEKTANLNAQETGDPAERAAQWKRFARNPVYDEVELGKMVRSGIARLSNSQMQDGGWGWFSGYGECSSPHITALVVNGLRRAEANRVAVVPGVIENGIRWLERYQAERVQKLKEYSSKEKNHIERANNLDALVFMTLTDAGEKDAEMREFLYRDRIGLAVYGKAMLGLALHKLGEKEKLDVVIKNIDQYLKQDDENQTAWLEMGNSGYWWYWYGSENETHAYYLKLLVLTEPKSEKASRVVKYLLNNRKNGTYWNSTRDTALCIEAMADYLKASEEDKPDMTVQVFLDGEKKKEEQINSGNLFSIDNTLVVTGEELKSGKRKIELKKKGQGPLYYNAYLTNFTLEDFISRAGLEIKIDRKLYRLKETEKTGIVRGARGQVVAQKEQKYVREEIKNNKAVKSGDLIEVELVIDSKNDYEYVIVEDMKAAGFEPIEVRSGYTGNEMGAYVEFRDERVCFFVGTLARGKHSVSYRLRAEVPGRFSALPAKANAMYAPELRANSDELKVEIK